MSAIFFLLHVLSHTVRSWLLSLLFLFIFLYFLPYSTVPHEKFCMGVRVCAILYMTVDFYFVCIAHVIVKYKRQSFELKKVVKILCTNAIIGGTVFVFALYALKCVVNAGLKRSQNAVQQHHHQWKKQESCVQVPTKDELWVDWRKYTRNAGIL